LKKRILTIAIALILLMAVPAPAFAWEYEDQQINKNAQMDGKKTRGYSLEDMLDGQGNSPIYPDSGDNIYVDIYSRSGDLAHLSILRSDDVRVRKYSTEEMANADPGNKGKWKSYGGAMFYFAPEPRGYNSPAPNEAYNRYKGLSGVFWVEVLSYSGFATYKWDNQGSVDRVLRDDVVASNKVNGTICTLYIPAGTHLSYPDRPGTLVTNLFVERDDCGEIYFEPGNMDFSQECAIACVADGVEEVVLFTQIRDGLPVE